MAIAASCEEFDTNWEILEGELDQLRRCLESPPPTINSRHGSVVDAHLIQATGRSGDDAKRVAGRLTTCLSTGQGVTERCGGHDWRQTGFGD